MQYWSYILTAVGILGLWLAGRKSRAGWAVGLGAQSLWIVYAVVSAQWGFIVSAVAYGTVYARNWIRWTSEAKEASRLASFRERLHIEEPPGGWPKIDVGVVRRAIYDPGQFVRRGDDYTESLHSWQARAVLKALEEHL